MNKEFKDHKVINDEKMKQNWEIIPFEDSIVKVKYTTKIPSNDYLEQGLYPIVSQEEGLISGYWNNKADVFKVSNPVIIFGDHTRILKYVDFDFVLGADGVKILQPIKGIDAKFFKLYLESCKIPSLGYSRHYKLLKELHIPIPPLPIQEKIVAELDCLRGVIEKKKEQLKELDALAHSIFYTMFGDPITNEKGWEVKKLGDSVIEMFLGPFGSALKTDCYVDKNKSYCMIYEQKHAIKKTMELETKYIDKDKFESLKRFEVHSGDFIMSCRGTIGEIFRLPNDAPFGIIHPSLMKIRINENVYHPLFFIRLLSIIVKNANTNGNCVQMAITAKELGTKKPILPPLTLQQEFAAKVEAIEKQKGLIKESIKEVEDLFNARMQYYFG